MKSVKNENNTWMEDVLDTASKFFDNAGNLEMVDSITRIKSVLHNEIGIFIKNKDAENVVRNFFETEQNTDDVAELFSKLKKIYQFTNITFSVCRPTPGYVHKKVVITTYSNEWISKYHDLEAWKYDPIFITPQHSRRPFFWSKFKVECPIVKNLFNLAVAHGVGRHGYTIPIHNKSGGIYSMTYTGDESERKFRSLINYHKRDIFTITELVKESYYKNIGIYEDSSLTTGEIELLNDIYCGAKREELINRDFFYGSFLSHEKSILKKLQATSIYHAAFIARERNIIEAIPTSLKYIKNINK